MSPTLLVTIAANALGIWLANRFVGGFDFTGTILELAGAAVLFALLNWIVRPIVKLITGPLIVLTLGLFAIVVNAAMLWLLDLFVPSLTIATLLALALATLIMTALNIVVGPLKHRKK